MPEQRARSEKSRARLICTVLLTGCLWLILIAQLRFDWLLNPQYSYGWLVTPLALYLFWKRWPTRPAPTYPSFVTALAILAGLLAFALLPVRLVQESAPYWTAVSWTMALQVIGLTLAALAYAGGWSWVRHFAGAVCFFLIAVPWPSSLETAVTQGLMQHVARLTAEILGWGGVPAVPQGNLIRLSAGVLGVDEACSGVRSIQSMLMAALFLGELYLLKWLLRIALVVVGLALALLFNVIRTLTLSIIANMHGVAALQQWHDTAGYLILFSTLAGLFLFVRLLASKPADLKTHSELGPARQLPWTVLLGIALWLCVVQVTTYAWYHRHETVLAPGWRISWPVSLKDFRELPITADVRDTLMYDEGCSLTWRGTEGSQWILFFFKWHPSPSSQQAARFHRPEVCIPATGRSLVMERPRIQVELDGKPMAFRSYVFDDNGRPLHVFFSLREGAYGEIEAADMMADSRKTRLKRVLEGRKDLGQQSVEVVIAGFASPEQAEAAFRERMKTIIVPAGPTKS